MKYQIPGWDVNPATILTFEKHNKAIEKMKKCEPNLCLPKENGRMAVNRMSVVNSSAQQEHIRTHLDGIPASEIEKKLCIRDQWHLAMTSFYDYPPSAIFTSMILPNAIGGFFANRLDTRDTQRWGMGTFVLCMAMLLASLCLDILPLFIAASIAAGFSQGIGFTASVTGLLGRTGRAERAGMFSTIYLTSYSGAAIPNLVVGMIPGYHSLEQILARYVLLTFAMFLVVLLATHREYRQAPPLEADARRAF